MSKVKCPVVSNLHLVSYPFLYRTNVELPSNSTFIGVFFPYNDMVGWGHKQAVYPPDNSTAVTNGFSTGPTLQDPFLNSIFTPSSTAADTVEQPAARATDFCVEVAVVTPLANVSGDCMVGVWRSTNFPNLGQPAGYGQAYSQMVEDPFVKVLPGASFTQSVCMHAAMRDRNALEPTTVSLGPTPYYNILRGINSIPSTNIDYVGVNAPWYPVVVYLANPTANTVNYLISARGTFEVQPAISNAWFRLATPRPISSPGAEAAWWRYQQRILSLGPVPGNTLNRNISGYIGVSTTKANKPAKKRNTTTTTTSKPSGGGKGKAVKQLMQRARNAAEAAINKASELAAKGHNFIPSSTQMKLAEAALNYYLSSTRAPAVDLALRDTL